MQLSISSDLERLIVTRATALGFPTPESYLRDLLENKTRTPNPSRISNDEFERLLDEVADDDVPGLPEDFSRADIYGEHP